MYQILTCHLDKLELFLEKFAPKKQIFVSKLKHGT